ncbi:hypothetical protein Tcan_01865 [Toxocara canis]|uniref:Uncharacterized protein n=1 Tax=Toxocara canis TaxID=6265 RepID=A0A0B2UT86_TOXCA|nr:hypothetical protein Tcan_01865 [Toxocara canis]
MSVKLIEPEPDPEPGIVVIGGAIIRLKGRAGGMSWRQATAGDMQNDNEESDSSENPQRSNCNMAAP